MLATLTRPLAARPAVKLGKLARHVTPTGVERKLGEDEIIVSKTDLKGRIAYGNEVFVRISGFDEETLLGAPHSILRHPEMPRAVFKLLWDTISGGEEIFAYVVNLARNGDHYWVFAHVTPSFDAQGKIVGYHSNRRRPRLEAVAKVRPIYAALLAAERAEKDRRLGLERSSALLHKTLSDAGVAYDEFVFSL